MRQNNYLADCGVVHSIIWGFVACMALLSIVTISRDQVEKEVALQTIISGRPPFSRVP